jgi:hypothetical protein
VTIGSLMQGGFRLIKERPGAMLIWTLIQLAMTIGTSFWMASLVHGLFEAVLSGESAESLRLSFVMQTLLVGIAASIVSTILYAAVQRAIIHPTEGGPAWLKLGMDELRFFLLLVLYSIIFGVALVIAGVVLGLFFAGAGAGGLQMMQYVILVLGFIACSYFGTKLSLSFPLTLKEKTFAIGEGWSLSNGRFWTLYGTYFIIFLLLLAVGIASSLVTEPEYLTAVFQYGYNSPQADQASLLQFQKLAAGTVDAPIIIGWVLTGVQGAIGAALLGGAAATAVQQLTADEEGLSDTFS